MMTDEQYNWLFNEEPCGYQDTPGFRDFLLELMATIGERPRAGDVAQMHLAYCAGRGAPLDWTTDRPTEPGEYWLSLPPKQRTNQQSAIPVVCHPSSGILGVYYDTGEWLNAVMSSALDGALWSVRETPADPFQEVGQESEAAEMMTAKEELLEEMRDTSELCVFAQWLSGLEFILWDAIEARNRVFPGSMGGEIDIGRLSDLSAKCGGWWIWDEESSAERFVTLAEWEAIRKARK